MLTVFRTIINLGGIQLDAYTANERDNKGNWINYLSGQGMAVSIGLHDTTTLQSRLSKELKALLGESFTTLQGTYKNSKGAYSKVNLWSTQYAAKYYRYHDRRGNEKAGLIIDALTATTLDILINDSLGRTYNQGDAAKAVRDRIRDVPSPWRRMYEKEVCDKAFSWYGADFYWQFCYSWMTPAERYKVNEINPIINGSRAVKIHLVLYTS